MQRKLKIIRCNKIKCKKCSDIIESTYVHDCKKVYGFSDVNYKDEKYREI